MWVKDELQFSWQSVRMYELYYNAYETKARCSPGRYSSAMAITSFSKLIFLQKSFN